MGHRVAPGRQPVSEPVLRRRAAAVDVPDHTSRGGELPPPVRARFERRFATSLAGVRLHTDAAAAASAQALDAHAYTVGRDVFFAAGRYQPFTNRGDHLLAHELVHAVQQRASPRRSRSLSVSHPGDRAERDADRAADAAVAGRSVRIAAGSEPLAVYRQGSSHQPPWARKDWFFDREEDEQERYIAELSKSGGEPKRVHERLPTFPVSWAAPKTPWDRKVLFFERPADKQARQMSQVFKRLTQPQHVARLNRTSPYTNEVPTFPYHVRSDETPIEGEFTGGLGAAKIGASYQLNGGPIVKSGVSGTARGELTLQPNRITDASLNAGALWNQPLNRSNTASVYGGGLLGATENDKSQFVPSVPLLLGGKSGNKSNKWGGEVSTDLLDLRNVQFNVNLTHTFRDPLQDDEDEQQERILKTR